MSDGVNLNLDGFNVIQRIGEYWKNHKLRSAIGTGLLFLGLTGGSIYYFGKGCNSTEVKQSGQKPGDGKNPVPSATTEKTISEQLGDVLNFTADNKEKEKTELKTGETVRSFDVDYVLCPGGDFERHVAHEQTLDGNDKSVTIDDLVGDLSRFNGVTLNPDDIYVTFEKDDKIYSVESEKEIPKGASYVRELADIDGEVVQIASVRKYGRSGNRHIHKIKTPVKDFIVAGVDINCGDNSVCGYDINIEKNINIEKTEILALQPEPQPDDEKKPDEQVYDFNLNPNFKEGANAEIQITNDDLKKLGGDPLFTFNLYDGADLNKTVIKTYTFEKEDVQGGSTIYNIKDKEQFPKDPNRNFKGYIDVDTDKDGKPNYRVEDNKWQTLDNEVDAKKKVEPKKPSIDENKDKDPKPKKDPDNRNPAAKKKAEEVCKDGSDYCKDLKPKPAEEFKIPDEKKSDEKNKDDGAYNLNLNGIMIGRFIIPGEFFVPMVVGAMPNNAYAFVVQDADHKGPDEVKPGLPPETDKCLEDKLDLEGTRPKSVKNLFRFGYKWNDLSGEVETESGKYKIRADQDLKGIKIVDDKGNEIKYNKLDNKEIEFVIPKEAKFVKVDVGSDKGCKKEVTLKNKEYEEKSAGKDKNDNIEDVAKHLGGFTGVTLYDYGVAIKSDSADLSYKGYKQTIGGGVTINFNEDVSVTPYVAQTETKTDIKDKQTDSDLGEFNSKELRAGVKVDVNLGDALDKDNTVLEDANVGIELDYLSNKSTVIYDDFDLELNEEREGFVGIGEIEVPRLFTLSDNVDLGAFAKFVYLDQSVKQDNLSTNVNDGLYGSGLLFTNDGKGFLPNEFDLGFYYRLLDDIESKQGLKGTSFKGSMLWNRDKYYFGLSGEFPGSGDVKYTDFEAEAGYNLNKYLTFIVNGGSRSYEIDSGINKTDKNENFVTLGVTLNEDNAKKVLDLLKSPFER